LDGSRFAKTQTLDVGGQSRYKPEIGEFVSYRLFRAGGTRFGGPLNKTRYIDVLAPVVAPAVSAVKTRTAAIETLAKFCFARGAKPV